MNLAKSQIKTIIDETRAMLQGKSICEKANKFIKELDERYETKTATAKQRRSKKEKKNKRREKSLLEELFC